MGNDKHPSLDTRVMLLLDLIDEHPDLTIKEIRTWLRTRNNRAEGPRSSRSVAKGSKVKGLDAESRNAARRAAYFGLAAALIVLGFSIYQVTKAIIVTGLDPSRNWAIFAAILAVIVLQIAAVIGLYFFSRTAAIGSFVIFLAIAGAVNWVSEFQSSTAIIATVVLLLAFFQGIRGTIAHHRHPKRVKYVVPH